MTGYTVTLGRIRARERALGRKANFAPLLGLHTAEAEVSTVSNMTDCVDKRNVELSRSEKEPRDTLCARGNINKKIIRLPIYIMQDVY
jgi:hypothetical protein